MNSFSRVFVNSEEKMIEIQYDIDKLEADKEFYQQKLRLVQNELEEKNEQLNTKRIRFDRLHNDPEDK